MLLTLVAAIGSFPGDGVTDLLREELSEAADMFGFEIDEIVRYGKLIITCLMHRNMLYPSCNAHWVTQVQQCVIYKQMNTTTISILQYSLSCIATWVVHSV